MQQSRSVYFQPKPGCKCKQTILLTKVNTKQMLSTHSYNIMSKIYFGSMTCRTFLKRRRKSYCIFHSDQNDQWLDVNNNRNCQPISESINYTPNSRSLGKLLRKIAKI